MSWHYKNVKMKEEVKRMLAAVLGAIAPIVDTITIATLGAWIAIISAVFPILAV